MPGPKQNTPDLQKLRTEYEDIKKKLDSLKLDKNKDQQAKEKEANQLIQDAQAKEKELKAEIDRIKNDKQANQAEKDAADDADKFLQQTHQEVQNLHDDIINSVNKPQQPNTPTQTPTTNNNDNFFTRAFNRIGGKFSDAGSWVGEQWNNIRDKNKWKDETGTNIARTVGFAATGIGALGLIYRGIKSLFGGGKDSKKLNGKEDEDNGGKESLLESAATRALKELTDKKSK